MAKITIQTARQIIPMIYAYSTPEIARHNGWVKIGYTERQRVEDRIKQQTGTADIQTKIEWKGSAIYDDGSGEIFHDSDFHSYLYKLGIEHQKEWFHINGVESQSRFYEFRSNRGVISDVEMAEPYYLREEQKGLLKQRLLIFEKIKMMSFYGTQNLVLEKR